MVSVALANSGEVGVSGEIISFSLVSTSTVNSRGHTM